MKAFLAIALLLTSCNPYAATGASSSCTLTLSGAVTGTFDCSPATTIYMPSFNRVAIFSFSIPQVDDKPGIDASISWRHEPIVGHYTENDPDADSGITVTMPLQPGQRHPTIYAVRVGPSAGGTVNDGSSYDLALDKVDGPFSRYTGVAYTSTGTLDAKLSGGDVTVHVSF